MNNDSLQKPTLVDTGRGWSVEYKNRQLYSRYNPNKNSIQTVKRLSLLPETIVLCMSPLLGYGLAELLDTLPARCCAVAIEEDENLMALAMRSIPGDIISDPRFTLIRTSSVHRLVQTLESLTNGPFRRIVRIDLSAGTQFNADFYSRATAAADDWVSRIWKNHLTMMKLGRNFFRNILRNLQDISSSVQISSYKSAKPVFVAGAGPSLDSWTSFIQKERSNIFLLAVDAALGSLIERNITPDAVIVVESQYWIEDAFARARKTGIPVFADLTARNGAIKATCGKVFYFCTGFINSVFLNRLFASGLVHETIPPLGSVGLVALEIANRISHPDSPVFCAGLDFAWGKAFTHAKGAPAVLTAYATSSRTQPVSSGIPDMYPGTMRKTSANGRTVWTNPSLNGYAELCGMRFSDLEHTVYTVSDDGLETGLQRLNAEEASAVIHASRRNEKNDFLLMNETACDAASFLDGERERLEEIRMILTGEASGETSTERLETLLSEADYLWLHFPDAKRGYTTNPDFLKRIRIETEYFLKTLKQKN